MARAKVESTEVATQGGALMVDERPEWMQDTSRGNEGVTSNDMTIPRVSIIQDLSPQHKKNKSEYIEGAEAGMAFNTVTGELYESGLMVVPVLFRKEWVIWKNLDDGGGFKGAFGTQSEAVAAMADLEDAEKCEVVDTAQHFVLIVDPDSTADNVMFKEAVISMSKSQMKPSRQWNSMIQASGGDRFSRLYRLDVVEDQNSAGQEYYNWKPKQLGYVNQALFQAAEKLYNAVKAGAMDVKRDGPAEEAHAKGKVEDSEEF
jgi:hypothetical protein